MIARFHYAPQPFYAVVDVAEASRLFAVAPNLDPGAVFCQSHFAAYGGGRFLFAALICAKRPIDIVKAHDSRVQMALFAVIRSHLLSEKLFPAVALLRIGGDGVRFPQRYNILIALQETGIDAR